MLPERPAVRPLDVQRVDGPEGRGIVLTDRLGVSEPTFIPEQLLPIVGRCTGELTLAEIRAAAARQYGPGEPLTEAFVRGIVQQLADRALLRGADFDAAVAELADRFAGAEVRPARHAGSAGYPAEPAALRGALARIVPPAAAPTDGGGPLRGLIAPHIDLARGAAGYAAAYGRLLRAELADLYVVFGTGHAGPSAPVVGLPLDWQTPLGRVATDRAFVAAVHAAIGAPAPADLLHHRDEHSLEFQVLFLQHLHALRGAAPPVVAGFLCGALPSASGDPLAEDYAQELVAAFRAAAAARGDRVCWLAGADLAHIGPFFGDPNGVDNTRLAELERAERGRLALLQAARPGAFHAAVECNDNSDRVCSAPAITLTAELAGGSGELLHYGQAAAGDGSQTVSFCAMAFA